MRRVGLAWLLTLCLMATGAWAAQEYTLGDAQRGDYHTCTDFDGAMPGDVAEIFASLMRAGDEVICRTMGQLRSTGLQEIRREWIVMAVRREGSVLLMGAYRRDGGWETCVETDNFMPADCAFDITSLPEEDGENWGVSAGPAIVCGNESYRLEVQPGGRITWNCYTQENPDGSRYYMEAYSSGLTYFQVMNGQKLDYGYERCSVPPVLAAWTMDMIPKNQMDQKIWAADYQPFVNSGEGYICSVNLRTKPTGSSGSLGKYSDKVKVLGSQPGTQAPWIHVRFGDTEGWVSGDYFLDGSEYDGRFYSMFMAYDPFARVDEEIALCGNAGGAEKARIPAGTLMHVFHQDGDWLHVIIPDRPVDWQTNWNGTYGFVRRSDVTVGQTLTDLKWK